MVSASVNAIEVRDLYQVKILVKDQSSKTQWDAVSSGFKEVLVRKSGSQRILTTDEVKQASKKVKSYLQRYEYSVNEDKLSKYAFELRLDFEPRLVGELIQAAGMPIWGSNRPVTILWLAMEKDYKRKILRESQNEDDISHIIMTESQRRGLPVILPLMDLEDELNVSISDLWGRFSQPVVNASKRYAADSIIFGRVRKTGEVWSLNVNYLNQGEEQRISLQDKTPELLISKLSNQLAELLCLKYCVVEKAQSHQVVIQISNINNYSNFKLAEKYLESLSSIRKVEVEKIGATVVRFNVSLLGELQSVKEGIELGKKLIVESAFEPEQFKQVKSQATVSGETENSYQLEHSGTASDTGVVKNGSTTSVEAGRKVVDTAKDSTTFNNPDSLQQGNQMTHETGQVDNATDSNELSGDESSGALFYRWVE